MTVDPKSYWLWLQRALGAGSSKPRRIFQNYGSVREFYEAGREAWLLEGYFTPKEIANMTVHPLAEAEATLEYARKNGQSVITPDDGEYPFLLRQIHAWPCALFVKGTIPDLSSRPPIAVVGTRKATATGRTAARSIAYELARKGSVIVSGGALGIDTAAHKGALQASGKTICVLGCGIGADYLMVNAPLRDVIAQNGALISEYPPNTQAMSSNFPIRNRIISGLAVGTLVVEAAHKSGSLITANYALEQDRDVFAVPADICSPVSQGVNHLIRDGAKPVCCAQDVLEEYQERFPDKICLDGGETDDMIKGNGIPKAGRAEANPSPKMVLSDDAKAVYAALTGAPVHLSVIGGKAKLSASRLLSALTELELCGAAQSYSGGRYSLPRGHSRNTEFD